MPYCPSEVLSAMQNQNGCIRVEQTFSKSDFTSCSFSQLPLDDIFGYFTFNVKCISVISLYLWKCGKLLNKALARLFALFQILY